MWNRTFCWCYLQHSVPASEFHQERGCCNNKMAFLASLFCESHLNTRYKTLAALPMGLMCVKNSPCIWKVQERISIKWCTKCVPFSITLTPPSLKGSLGDCGPHKVPLGRFLVQHIVFFSLLQDEIFDMVKPKDPLKISLQDLINSNQGDTVTTILIDLNGFWTYENREALVANDNENSADLDDTWSLKD